MVHLVPDHLVPDGCAPSRRRRRGNGDNRQRMIRWFDVLEEFHQRLHLTLPGNPRVVPRITTRPFDSEPGGIRAAAHEALDGEERATRVPEGHDGETAERIDEILLRSLAS